MCLPCHELCRSCKGSSKNCDACIPTAFLKDHECVTDCGYGYTNSLDRCFPCPENCTSCLYNSLTAVYLCTRCVRGLFLHQGLCRPTCPKGMFGAQASGLCESCDRACATCIAGSFRDCITCNETAGFARIGTVCSLPVCADGSYYLETLRRCLSIHLRCHCVVDCPKGCARCWTAAECLDCAKGYLLNQGLKQCEEECLRPGFRYKFGTTKCEGKCRG